MAPRPTTSLSTEGLARLHEALAAHVGPGRLPGLVSLVASGDSLAGGDPLAGRDSPAGREVALGEVHIDPIGTPSSTDTTPLRRDAIWRIASLSKPVTAVAVLSLVEQGRLGLDQPIDELVPELANRRVLRTIDAELDDTVPATRSITVEDLLSSRFGFGTVLAPPGSYPIQRAEADAELQSIGGPPWPPGPHNPDSWIAALGALPLMYQPGEQWLYNTSGQVLGVLLARAGGQELELVLQELIFEPLGMVDTGFSVPPEKWSRLPTFYAPDPDTGQLSVLDEPGDSWWGKPPARPDASGWLVSTIDDYWTFVSMLLAGGTANGQRILSPETVEWMMTDQLTPAQRLGGAAIMGENASWGWGMQVPPTGSTDLALPTGIGWNGGSGTTWRTNRHSGITGILFTQCQAISPAPPPVIQDFWAGVNAATLPA
jgi:CubicO group peptidase (beta-lactamase class C family)